MESRLESFEKKTKAAMFNFNQVALITFIGIRIITTMFTMFTMFTIFTMFILLTMFNFNQNMKESFAEERNDCQERMERR